MGNIMSEPVSAHYDITQLAQNGQTVGVVYVDCAKTFDQIDFVVISGQGNTDNPRTFDQYLIDSSQAGSRHANGARSQPTEVKSGIAQSEVCRTILFLILIGEIKEKKEILKK